MVMRRQGVLLALALVTGAAGCSSFLAVAARNIAELPVQSCDEARLEARDRRRAEAAWERVVKDYPDQCWAKDYAKGFKAGYADYLTNGGNGEPPATPPFGYRLRPYQTPQGLRQIDEWYAGFRHGAAVGRASGYRETIVIPLSSPPINAVERLPNTEPPIATPTLRPPEEPPLAVPEALPPEPVPIPDPEESPPPKNVSPSE
jgi:hypothetical protein